MVSAVQCPPVSSQLTPGAPWSGGRLGANGPSRTLKHTHVLLRTSAGDTKKCTVAIKYGHVKCHPGAPSGLTPCPRYPLKWQGHWVLWVSQILKHTNFLLKTMPKSARLPLNMGMVNGVKGHPGPSSGPTTCPSCTLKWQGHQGPWDVPHSQP